MPAAPHHQPVSAHKWRWPRVLLVVLGIATSATAVAEISAPLASTQTNEQLAATPGPQSRLEIDKSYALGIANFDLDHETEVTGWQVGERWFFGRQRGLDSGLTLVWQQQSNQVSVSRDGVRFTRRF